MRHFITQGLGILAGGAFGLIVFGCGGGSGDRSISEPKAAAAGSADCIWFEERAETLGLSFEHTSGFEQRYELPENMSGGVGLIDFDGDGWLDVYLVQGGDLHETDAAPGNRLFRSEGGRVFRDVTESAGVGDRGYGMGVACADYDGDGHTDIYVTNVGRNVLYRNEGAGTFRDVTDEAGVGGSSWGTSAAFLDYDADGALDLFVTNYVAWSQAAEPVCYVTSRGDLRDYCPPKVYQAPAPDTLFRNRGDGVFVDVTEAAGISRAFGNGLGVTSADFDGDGRVDVYVSNDGTPNQLWLQKSPGRFEDHALLFGCALSGTGQPEAGMGVMAADVEADGDLDLFLAHLRGESNTAYLLEGGLYDDRTASLGIAATSRRFTSFGLGLADFDNDGRLDLYVANGHVSVEDPVFDPEHPYAQPNQVFRGVDGVAFKELTPYGATQDVLVANSRAAAFGDIDEDGDVDIVVVNRDGPVHVFVNTVGQDGSWVAFSVVNERGELAIGAVVTVQAGELRMARLVQPAYSYQASNDPRVHFGLGAAARVNEVRVTWPDGNEESFGECDARAVHVLRKGAGGKPLGRK